MTLPKEFRNFYYSREYKWTEEDIVQCKELLTPCDPNARERGGYKQTALHYLVPASGKCATVQGEVVRITGSIDSESNGNSGANWDAEYRKMLKALLDFFMLGNALDVDDIKAAQEAACGINKDKAACCCGKEIDMLVEFAVRWVRQNPTPIPLNDVNYCR